GHPRCECAGDVEELAAPVKLGFQVAAGGAVGHVHLDLDDAEALALEVDGHRGLDAEAAREWAGGLEGGPGKAALAVQRLGRGPAGRAAYPGAGESDHEAVPAQLNPAGGRRDGHVGGPSGDWLDERACVR